GDPLRRRHPGRGADPPAHERPRVGGGPRPRRCAADVSVRRAQGHVGRRERARGLRPRAARVHARLLPCLPPHRRVRDGPRQRQHVPAAVLAAAPGLAPGLDRARRPASRAAPSAPARRGRGRRRRGGHGPGAGPAHGIPVISGTIDAWTEAASVGATRPGDLMLMYGTTTFLVATTDEPLASRTLWPTSGLTEGTYTLSGGMATSG